jgi:orotidine-5'-phosphate decarboxylase
MLAHMSSAGNLLTQQYTSAAVAMAAEDQRCTVAGFIGQDAAALSAPPAKAAAPCSQLSTSQQQQRAREYLMLTPGVSLPDHTAVAAPGASVSAPAGASAAPGAGAGAADGLGQQYVTVRDAVMRRGADIIIVGRGIIKHARDGAEKVAEAAARYRDEGWQAYLDRLNKELA